MNALSLRSISKRFGITTALIDANLVARTGTVHALLGENGAGKTTLMRIAFGMIHPDSGEIVRNDQVVVWNAPVDAIRSGVGMVHQHFTLVPTMTVTENIELGTVNAGSLARWYKPTLARQRASELSRTARLEIDPEARVADLPIAAQQRVEILKALRGNAEVLILDEPTAGLAPQEADELLGWLRRHADNGSTIILITHKLREALSVADDITVLRRGITVFSGSRLDIDEKRLTTLMIGEEQRNRPEYALAGPSQPHREKPAVVLKAINAADQKQHHRISGSLTVYPGEILGIVGLEGSGHRLLLRILAGRLKPTSGELLLPQTIGFIPEDRQRDALILEFSIVENIALSQARSDQFRVQWPAVARQARALIEDYSIQAVSETVPVSTLSGGNQQRLVLARALADSPQLVVAENPTRGLDVRAAAEIHHRLRNVARAGSAVVIYSSDLDEVLGLASRVLAVYSGQLREVPNDRSEVGRAMLGVAN